MVTTFKEALNGFYCSECRMSFSEPQTTCPYCGSLVTNYEELVTQKESPEILIGGRWYEEQEPELELDEEKNAILQKVLAKLKEIKNESNIS